MLAELLSLVATLAVAQLTFYMTQSQITTALMATLWGNVVYFGCILVSDVIATKKECATSNQVYNTKTLLKNIRAMFVEFGVAEVIDSLLVRPALMYYLPILVGDLSLGTFLAKIAADLSFYVPTIIFYEISKKGLRNFTSH